MANSVRYRFFLWLHVNYLLNSGSPGTDDGTMTLPDHSLCRQTNVLDVTILHAQVHRHVAVKSASRRLRDQLRQGHLNLLNFIHVRRRMYLCFDHGVTLAGPQKIPTTIFGHLVFSPRRHSEQGVDEANRNHFARFQIVNFNLYLSFCDIGSARYVSPWLIS